MANLEYLKAKTAEYAVVLFRLNKELQTLGSKKVEHQWLVNYLQGQLEQAQTLHKRLQSIVEIGHSRLLPRALPIIHDIEFSTFIINYHYLPALQKESEADLALRKLLLLSAERCGLFWIKDIAVNLEGPLAILPTPPEAPLITAPPQQAVSLLEMPGLYHELGHDVFQKFHEIAENLGILVYLHFNELRQKSGRITPERKIERNQQIDQAVQYWNTDRLNEIFCDIFGTFACGAAHYISCVDMGLRSGHKPFDVDLGDEHPPLSARVYACYKALTPNQQNEQSVITIGCAWENYKKAYPQEYDFNFICSEALLDLIVKVAIDNIQNFLPDSQRYEVPLPENSQIQEIPLNTSLEDILNRGVHILLTCPESYEAWEAKAFKILGFCD
ncbi:MULTISPECIES: hypothetical protein [unclassified Microcoleus]|uniref:hypothetical protein n=1 Tax=unclassified Microcoleus TaxID=2642155 RepID=UPI002FD74E80